jgi:hypothetical protein
MRISSVTFLSFDRFLMAWFLRTYWSILEGLIKELALITMFIADPDKVFQINQTIIDFNFNLILARIVMIMWVNWCFSVVSGYRSLSLVIAFMCWHSRRWPQLLCLLPLTTSTSPTLTFTSPTLFLWWFLILNLLIKVIHLLSNVNVVCHQVSQVRACCASCVVFGFKGFTIGILEARSCEWD